MLYGGVLAYVGLHSAASKIVSTILLWNPVVLRWLAREELILL